MDDSGLLLAHFRKPSVRSGEEDRVGEDLIRKATRKKLMLKLNHSDRAFALKL